MAEPTIICPKCNTEIRLTEQFAAPIVAATRAEYEQKIALKAAEAADHEKQIREREEAVRRAQETVQQQIADQLRVEKAKIASEEARKAKAEMAGEFQQKAAETAALHENLKQNNAKLLDAQKAQLELMKLKQSVEDERREIPLTVQKQVQAELADVRHKAQADAEESLKLKMAEKELRLTEKDQTIAAMKKQLEDAQRRAEQGSQQSQGEALELQLEALLAARFPHDRIEPVPKGQHGGDILHRIHTPGAGGGLFCGTILWESKRTKTWSDGWLPKLRDDQRAATAELAIIVSAVLPKGIDTFDHVDGIWITHPRCLLPVALALRHSLLELAAARQATQGQQSKMELTYQYLTGPKFRHRVQAIVEKFDAMREDLNTERKTMTKLWAKREAQITAVLDSTAGLFGDLQGIAGKSLQEIEGLEMKMLESPNQSFRPAIKKNSRRT